MHNFWHKFVTFWFLTVFWQFIDSYLSLFGILTHFCQFFDTLLSHFWNVGTYIKYEYRKIGAYSANFLLVPPRHYNRSVLYTCSNLKLIYLIFGRYPQFLPSHLITVNFLSKWSGEKGSKTLTSKVSPSRCHWMSFTHPLKVKYFRVM